MRRCVYCGATLRSRKRQAFGRMAGITQSEEHTGQSRCVGHSRVLFLEALGLAATLLRSCVCDHDAGNDTLLDRTCRIGRAVNRKATFPIGSYASKTFGSRYYADAHSGSGGDHGLSYEFRCCVNLARPGLNTHGANAIMARMYGFHNEAAHAGLRLRCLLARNDR